MIKLINFDSNLNWKALLYNNMEKKIVWCHLKNLRWLWLFYEETNFLIFFYCIL